MAKIEIEEQEKRDAEIADLFQIIEDHKQELNQKIDQMCNEIKVSSDAYNQIKTLQKQIEHQKQLVQEYRLYKDPKSNELAVKALQDVFGNHAVKIEELRQKLKKFEEKQWLRILSDQEITEQYEKAGKPSMTTIAQKMGTTPENAFNYVHNKVKDPKIRWRFYTECCGGA